MFVGTYVARSAFYPCLLKNSGKTGRAALLSTEAAYTTTNLSGTQMGSCLQKMQLSSALQVGVLAIKRVRCMNIVKLGLAKCTT